MCKPVKIAAVLGLVVPSATIAWALWEDMDAADRRRTAWQIYWMDNEFTNDEAARAEFRTAHPEFETNRVPEIVLWGSVATFTYYTALFGAGWLARRHDDPSTR